jgi:glucokinase
MSDVPLAIGIDFGGTTIKAGVVYQSNIIDHAPPIATQEFEGPEELVAAIGRVVEDLQKRHPGVASVGVGMPGLIDFEKGIVHNLTNVREWVQVPLRDQLAEMCGLPVVVDNDANCMAFAEWKCGAGRGMRHLVCLTLGTGVGGGIIVDGRLVRGSRFGAGEIGQTSIDYQGRTGHYGNRGALEDYIGNQEIMVEARETYLRAGVERSLENCTPAALATAAYRDDPIALKIWDDIGNKLATAIMNCCWLLNPQAIVLGGGVARAGEVLFRPLNEHLIPQLSGPFRDHLMILPATFCNEAGTIGAAALSLEEAGYKIEHG